MKIKENYVAIKQKSLPSDTDLHEVYALIGRVSSKAYADAVLLELYEGDGFDAYEVSDADGKILIRGTSGVALASGFNAYLKERCGYSIGILSTSGTLPLVPPAVGEAIKRKSKFLYRYFFNYCTFSYTYAFDNWEEWEKTLDYLLLSGYNLILNPIGLETVWRNTLLSIGYTEKQADEFLCGPAFYAWQWMMNMTGWAGGVPKWWYEDRKALAGKINLRLHALGASALLPGYVGMVPRDFKEHFPNAKLIDQGRWIGLMDRPALLMPEDPLFDRIADAFYAELKSIDGAEYMHYYSVDPFHEGGITNGIDLFDYAQRTFAKMREIDQDAVWTFQGWGHSPKADMIRAIPDGRVLITNLMARANCEKEDLYAGAPWCYCAVYCFGAQYYLPGDPENILVKPHKCLEDENVNMIGIGYMPEGVNGSEIIFEILAYNAFAKDGDLEAFISYYLKTRYDLCNENLVRAWTLLCTEVLSGKQHMNGESALCARPNLAVSRTSAWAGRPNPFVDQTLLLEYVSALLDEYDALKDNNAYRKDLVLAARQTISNLSWYFAKKICLSYTEKDVEAVSYYGKELLSLFDLQTAIVATDGDMLLGKWLEKAKRHGKTDAERAYFEWNARVQITLWADREGAIKLRDYAAKEWQGLLEDFYRPRWESFISRLEISLLTDRPLEEIQHYDEELPFVYRKNVYTTTPFGDLREAVCAALDKIRSTKIVHQVEKEKQASFVETVMKDIGE